MQFGFIKFSDKISNLGWRPGLVMLWGCVIGMHAQAGDRLLGTWGVSQIEGAGGGGLTPWATITGTGSSNQVGGSAFATHLQTQDGYQLKVAGVGVGVHDRMEFSMARWSFRLGDTVPGKSLEMSVAGAKFRVGGDAVYDQDRLMPQISVGAQYKQVADSQLVKGVLGATSTSDVDVYAVATKLWLGGAYGRNVIVSTGARLTRANQFGLAGFGGPGKDQRRLQLEGSIGLMPRDDLVIGAEYRMKPNNLQAAGASDFLREDDAWDFFIAWFPWRHVSLTMAWVNLGNIVGQPSQEGLYVSGQFAY
jgi:hypothetical protein